MPGLDPNALHIINGDSAASSLQQALGSSNRLIVSRDVLSCGPVRAFTDLESWRQLRVGYWRDVMAYDPQVDLRPPQNGMWENQARLVSTPRIYAWAATGNTDQFFVAFLLELLECIGTDPGKVELVEFIRAPSSGRRVVQMGEVDATQMRMHPPPRALSMDEWMAYRRAWRALTSDDPRRVENFETDDPQASDHLKRAMRHVLRRYPARADGLDFWDRQLLTNVRARGPNAGRVIGHTMGERFDEGDLIGDVYFFSRLLQMSAVPRPLLSLTGGRNLHETNVDLTEFGAQVLDGNASSWPDNPIDYWAGGVHLTDDSLAR